VPVHIIHELPSPSPFAHNTQAASAMRQARFPHIIAGVTGNVMEDDVAEYLDAGADVVFSKPVRLQALKKLLAMIEKVRQYKSPSCAVHPGDVLSDLLFLPLALFFLVCDVVWCGVVWCCVGRRGP